MPTFKTKGAPKRADPATAQVQLSTWDGAGDASEDEEKWFARRSSHDDMRGAGTAEWDEFVEGLFVRHSVYEMEYTPDGKWVVQS